MSAVFVSYRRDSSLVHARALYERLSRELGAGQVFIDLDDMEFGVDFVEHINAQLGGCSVLLALMEPGWALARDQKGQLRLHSTADFVRIEIATALRRGIRVVPILINDASMPDATDLPDELKPLTQRNALSLDFKRFDAEVGRLVAVIRRILGSAAQQAPAGDAPLPATAPTTAPAPPMARRPAVWLLAAGGLAGLGVAGMLLLRPDRPPDPATAVPRAVAAASLPAASDAATPSATASTAAATLLAAAPVAAPGAGPASTPATPAANPAPTPAAAKPAATPTPAPAQAQSPAARQSPFPAQVFRECAECPTMVVVPAGSFMMGSPTDEPGRTDTEGPQRRVAIASFAIGRTEVTQAQWTALMGRNPSHFQDCGDACPVEMVSWDDAQEYIRRLRLKTGKPYALATESQWEYAARAGTTTPFHTGHAITTDQANYGSDAPVRVASFPPNRFGLHDMLGNVVEWVQDCYDTQAYAGKAPSDGAAYETTPCDRRSLRGGSFAVEEHLLGVARRRVAKPDIRHNRIGLRVCRLASTD